MASSWYIPFQAFDFVKGTQINRFYRFFKSTLSWSETDVRTFQAKRLKEILCYANRHSAFYQRRFEEINFIPDAFKDIEELQRIPPLTRRDLQTSLNEIITTGDERKYLASSSSGTTGVPVKYLQDIYGYSAGVAAGYLLWSLAGWKPGHKGIHLWGNPESVKKWKTFGSQVKHFIYRQKYYPAFNINFESRIDDFMNLYRRFKPESIDGYSQSLYTVARYLGEHGIRLQKCRFVLGTAENLFPHQKDTIEKYLGPFSDLYGFGEINGIAIKPAQFENFVVLDTRSYLEGLPGITNDTNEIAVTDLFNKILPFIRYKPGDLFSGITDRHPEFPQFRSFNKLEGRTANIIELPDGKMVHPVNLLGGTFFRTFLALRKHKVIWDGNELNFIFEVFGNYNETGIEKALHAYLNEYKVPFRLTFTDSLSSDSSGKYNYFENKASGHNPVPY